MDTGTMAVIVGKLFNLAMIIGIISFVVVILLVIKMFNISKAIEKLQLSVDQLKK